MIYCGNNAKHRPLVEGRMRLGSRFECLQKGKLMGLSSPKDPKFAEPYEPIDKTKKYCGNKEILPEDYDQFGGLYECYLKGMGVGKRLKATGEDDGFNNFNKKRKDKGKSKRKKSKVKSAFKKSKLFKSKKKKNKKSKK